MSYATRVYGSTEYAGRLGGTAAPAPAAPSVGPVFDIPAQCREVFLQLQPDPTVPFENREVRAMSSATIDPVIFVKDPAATKDYSLDWQDILASGETISGSTWAGGGLTASGGYIIGDKTFTFLAGGVVDTVYAVSCTITTSAGRTLCRQFLISVELT